MEVVVFGAGSLGSLIGGMLATVHDVTLVGREAHVAAIEADGLRIDGEIETTIHPSAATSPPPSADLVVVTVKAYDTATAAEVLSGCDLSAALSLQNGLGNEEILAQHLDCPVLAGTCTYGARFREPGRVECTGIGDVALGPREGGESTIAEEVGRAFEVVGIETTVAADMPTRCWEKLAVNAAINPVTALAGVPNGALATEPAATVARRAARETAAVARANDVALADERAVAAMERVVEDTAANHSSMLQDVDAGRRTEIDAIAGAILARADAGTADTDAGTADADGATTGDDGSVDVPITETLAALVRAWEADRGLR